MFSSSCAPGRPTLLAPKCAWLPLAEKPSPQMNRRGEMALWKGTRKRATMAAAAGTQKSSGFKLVVLLLCASASPPCHGRNYDGGDFKTVGTRGSESPGAGLPDCMNVTVDRERVGRFPNGDLRLRTGYGSERIANYTFVANQSAFHFCFPLSPQLLACDLIAFDSRSYDIADGNGTLTHGPNFSAKLGDYYINRNGTAFACTEPIRPSYDGPRCNYLDLKPAEYDIKGHESVYVKSTNVTIARPMYVTDDSGTAKLCYPLSIKFLNCGVHVALTAPRYVLQADRRLQAPDLFQTFEPDEYYIQGDRRKAMVPFYDAESFSIVVTHSRLISKIYSLFYFLSITCLLLTLVYLFLQDTWNCHAKCMLCYLVSLVFWYLVEMVRRFFDKIPVPQCYALFFLQYFSLMAALFWLNILTVDICRSFSRLKSSPNRGKVSGGKSYQFLYYSVYAWGMPSALGCFAIVVDNCPALQEYLGLYPGITAMCWFNSRHVDWVFYHGPLILISVANAICYILTIRYIHQASEGTDLVNHHRKQQLIAVSIKLFIIMGIWWISEGIMWTVKDYLKFPDWYVSDVITGLQGVAIFIIYTLRHATFQQIVDYLSNNCSSFSAGNRLFDNYGKPTKEPIYVINNDVNRRLSNDTLVTQLSLSLQ